MDDLPHRAWIVVSAVLVWLGGEAGKAVIAGAAGSEEVNDDTDP